MSSLMREEKYLKGGKAILLCTREDHSESFRLIFRKEEWKEDEWIRIDSGGKGAYLQIRRKLGEVRCGEAINLLKRILEAMDPLNGVISHE